MDKIKHDILRKLTVILTEAEGVGKRVEEVGNMIEKYTPITNIPCEVCGEMLYEIKDKYVCLKCKRVIDNPILKGGD